MNKIDFEWDDNKMREEYDLSQMKSRPNPYAKQLKKRHQRDFRPTSICTKAHDRTYQKYASKI